MSKNIKKSHIQFLTRDCLEILSKLKNFISFHHPKFACAFSHLKKKFSLFFIKNWVKKRKDECERRPYQMKINDTFFFGQKEMRRDQPSRNFVMFFAMISRWIFKMQICSVQSWLLIIISFLFSPHPMFTSSLMLGLSVFKFFRYIYKYIVVVSDCCLNTKRLKIYYGNSFWRLLSNLFAMSTFIDFFFIYNFIFCFHLLWFWVARFHVVCILSIVPLSNTIAFYLSLFFIFSSSLLKYSIWTWMQKKIALKCPDCRFEWNLYLSHMNDMYINEKSTSAVEMAKKYKCHHFMYVIHQK